MVRNITVLLLYSLILSALVRWCCTSKSISFDSKCDTVRIVRIDTILVNTPPVTDSRLLRDVVEVRVVDTLYMSDTIYRERIVYLPREQHHYNKDGLYDLWISGVEPALDSLRVYHRNEVATINRGYTSRWSLYGSVRFSAGGYPSIGLLCTTRGRFACGVEMGGVSIGEPTYSVMLAYRLMYR